MSDSLYAINGDATGGGGGGAPSGPAGGDLGGTYPDPTVTDLTIASEARGDLLRRGASAWERVAAKTSGTVVTGDGTDVVSATIATALAVAPTNNRSALGWAITSNPMTGVGWTTAAGAGTTATWGAGKLALHVDAGATTTATGSELSSLIPDDEEYDVLARAQVVTGNGSTVCNVSLWAGRNANNCVLFQLWINGGVGAGLFVGGAYTSLLNATAATSSGDRTGGELWARISRSRTGLAMFWGVGTGGALPTSWTCAYAGTLSAAGAQTPAVLTSSQGTYGRLDIYCGAPLGTALDVDVLAITTTAQGGARL